MTSFCRMAVVCLTCLVLSGCGAASGPDALMKQQIALMNELSDVYDTIKDVPSAEAAAPRIQAIGQRKQGITAKFGELKLTQDQHQELAARHRDELAAATMRMLKSRPKDAQVIRNPKLQEALKSVR